MESLIYTLGPSAAVLLGLSIVVRLEEARRNSAKERPPIRERLLRPAGHSTKVRAEALQQKGLDRAILCLMAAVALGYFLSRGPLRGPSEIMTALALSGAVVVGFTLAFHPLRQARSYLLGARGEQFMGQELNELLVDGYRVFHDFAEENWNIDHIVIGPGGVFAIETKTRRRRRPKAGRQHNEVVFDGKELRYAWCEDRTSVSQARRNAQSLARILASGTGQDVEVTPILALPGWWVTLRARCDVPILSGRQVVAFIRSYRSRRHLPDEVVEAVVRHLDQKCRDVEF